MSVTKALNEWGRHYLMIYNREVSIPEGAEIFFDEEAPSPYYCETCGPDPYYTRITYPGNPGVVASYYGSLGDLIQEILESEKEDK